MEWDLMIVVWLVMGQRNDGPITKATSSLAVIAYGSISYAP
jgi:hypothetical protein